jgi:hypothetical protein
VKRGEHSPASTRDRKKLQRHKKRYMELREELQLAGEIPTEPEGAIRDERVDPASQGTQPLPALTGQAARNGWAVPDEKKPALVDELIDIIDDPDESNKVKVAAFNALRQADDSQWDRDHPKEDDKTSRGVTTLNVNIVNVEGGSAAVPLEVLPQEDQGEAMLGRLEVVPSGHTEGG